MLTLGLCIINKTLPITKVLDCYLREVVLHCKVSVFLQTLPAMQRDKSRSWSLYSFGSMAVCCPYFHKFQQGNSSLVWSVLTVLALSQRGCLLWEVLVFGCPIFSPSPSVVQFPRVILAVRFEHQHWARLCGGVSWQQVGGIYLHSGENTETTRTMICSGSAVGDLGWRTAAVYIHGYAQMTSTRPPSLPSFWVLLPKAVLSGTLSNRKRFVISAWV